MRSSLPLINDYASAAAYLDAGKKSKANRPHGTSRRIVRDFVQPGTISVVYHRTPIVTWFDGEPDKLILWFNGWLTATTDKKIAEYSGLERRWVDGEIKVPGIRWKITGRTSPGGRGDGINVWSVGTEWPRTPSKKQNCRSCKGTGQRAYKWHNSESDCYNCHAGIKEHGDKAIPLSEDGYRPLLVEGDAVQFVDWDILLGDTYMQAPVYSCTCKLCVTDSSSWQDYYGTYGAAGHKAAEDDEVPAVSHGYSDSGDVLSRVLPGLSTHHACPAPKCETSAELQWLIVHMNDTHRWTRESIADWLETLDTDLAFPVAI